MAEMDTINRHTAELNTIGRPGTASGENFDVYNFSFMQQITFPLRKQMIAAK
jgi:hypothetical protein